jgi:hypothetical protein
VHVQVETSKTPQATRDLASLMVGRNRASSGYRFLKRRAERRRRRANLMMAASVVGVLAFVRVLYELLSR